MEISLPSTTSVWKTSYPPLPEYGKIGSPSTTSKTGLPTSPEYEKQFKIATTRVNTTEPEFVNV
jgi:hypothetical protein